MHVVFFIITFLPKLLEFLLKVKSETTGPPIETGEEVAAMYNVIRPIYNIYRTGDMSTNGRPREPMWPDPPTLRFLTGLEVLSQKLVVVALRVWL